MPASRFIRTGNPVLCAGAERFVLSSQAWRDLPAALRADPLLDLVAMWADPTHVHALFGAASPLIASVPVEAGLYGALSTVRPGAALFERMIADLWGHQAADGVDARPWLDHGAWTALRPMSERPVPNTPLAEIPEFLPAPPGSVGWTAGPLGSGIVEGPVQWRVAMARGVVVQVEARGGYGHRGALSVMCGRSPGAAARVAARISGPGTVAHATAVARACEAAANVLAPARAVALRTALGAIERVAVGLHDVSDVDGGAFDRTAASMQARERILQACAAAMGHRLLMDVVVPGGIGADVSSEGVRLLCGALDGVPLHRHDQSWRFAGQGRLSIGDVLMLGVPGPAGRASGRLDPATPGAPLEHDGDIPARVRLRAAALDADVVLARETLALLPDGPVLTTMPPTSGEGLGFAKGAHGRVWHWVRLQGGVIEACFAADPAWLLLPAMERAGQGGAAAALPAVAASFGLHVSGMDL